MSCALAATGPSASQLLAKVKNCSVVSHGKYATDDGESSTVNICKPSPVESNSAIDSKGISAANAFVNS